MKLRMGKYIIVLNITNSYYIEEFFPLIHLLSRFNNILLKEK